MQARDGRVKGMLSWLIRLSVGLLLGFLVWNVAPLRQSAQPGEARSKLVGEYGNPENIFEVRLGWDGETIIRRRGGLQKRTPGGERAWGLLSLQELQHLPPLAVYRITPTPNGDVLALGVVENSEHTMGIYRVAGRDGSVSLEGTYPEMAPIDIEATANGRVFVLAGETHQLNPILTGAEVMRSRVEFGLLYELTPDGLVPSGFPWEFAVATRDEVLRRIEDMEELRLVADPDDRLYVYHRQRGMLRRIEPESGRVTGANPLSVAGFPYQFQINNLQFTSPDQVVYSLYEIGRDGFISGYQAYRADLAAGTFDLLYRHQGNPTKAIWETYYDPATDRLRLIDTLGPGRQGMRDFDSQLPGPVSIR